jgi:hypothetical protein
MTPTQLTPGKANSAAPIALPEPARVVAAANADEVMREQLEYLIEHASAGVCGCLQCERYARARSVLLEIFRESRRS